MAKKKITDLRFDTKNFNTGTQQGNALLEKSIQKFGFREAATIDKNGILIGGNKRTAKAGELGFEDVEIIQADPKKVYALQYSDIDIDTPQGRELALALNQTALKNIVIDAELVEAELSEAISTEWQVVNYAQGSPLNSMTENDLDLTEEFDPIGTSKGLQRVVFIFDGPEEAESYLNKDKIKFEKRNMAWQVNMSSQSIL